MPTKVTLKVILVAALTLSLLSSCRYLELYRFSEQFCSFDKYISITPSNTGTEVTFAQPTLKRELLLRYLGAKPFSSEEHNYSDLFLITNSEKALNQPFSMQVSFHSLDDYKLLESGRLDSRLSSVFQPKLIQNILLSFCTNDYDLGTKRLEFRFKIDQDKTEALPTKRLIQDTFGLTHPKITTINEALNYQLAFIDKSGALQHNKVSLGFKFDQQAILERIHIQYYKYDYRLDLREGKGRLIVTRN